MRISELEPHALADLLANGGIGLDFGAARARIRSESAGLASAMHAVYPRLEVESADGFFDVTLELARVAGPRRWFRPQVEVRAEGKSLFAPFPADTHLPLLEWSMNFMLAERLGFHLLLHAGVVERNGLAVILPALPGSGKSTLTAALSTRGFRLLSDEFGVVRLNDSKLLPMLRPVALKNESIDVIARFAPTAVIGPRFPKTRKGTVAHLAADADTVARRREPATAALIVFPRFDPRVGLSVTPEKPSRAFSRVAVNSFNYEMLGAASFDAVARLFNRCTTWNLVYSDLDRAIETIEELLQASTEQSGDGADTLPRHDGNA